MKFRMHTDLDGEERERLDTTLPSDENVPGLAQYVSGFPVPSVSIRGNSVYSAGTIQVYGSEAIVALRDHLIAVCDHEGFGGQ